MSGTDVLVSADWAEHHLDTAGVVFVEVDEDVTAYGTGHIPGAVKMDWKLDLHDSLRRDFVNKEQFEALVSIKGIGNDDTRSRRTKLPSRTVPSARFATRSLP